MFDSTDASLVTAARDILRERGPMFEDELEDALDAAGVALDPAAQAALGDILDDHHEPVHWLADERLAWIPGVLDGRVFTHRLTADEAEHDVLPWNPDLAPLSLVASGQDFARLADGAPISELFAELGEDFATRGAPESVDPGGGVLLLPPGRLAELGAAAGDLVGLRVTATGFAVEKVAQVAPFDLGASLTELLDDNPDEPVQLAEAVWTLCADDHSPFREPTAPLGDLVGQSGLDYDTGLVAPAGFDFDSWRLANRLEFVSHRHDLDLAESLAVLATKTLFDSVLGLFEAAEAGDADQLVEVLAAISQATPPAAHASRSPGAATVGMALGPLGEPRVAAAVFEEIGGGDERESLALRMFAETLEPMAPRAARPALRWLRAQALEGLGEVEAAEAALEAAESLDPSWPLTLVSLARYASDRGNAERALSLLRRAGAPDDDEMVRLLSHFRPAPRPGMGRNERCWCGSGRKYKVCHLNREQLPLEERAAWLYQKSSADLLAGPFTALVLEAGQERARHSDSPDALAEALGDGLVFDVALVEGGAFEDFLDRRGCLLPDDELLLAQQWLLAERSVHEVVAVRPGQGMTLRDVRTGDVNEVRERAGSTQVKVGQLYCARVVPAGETTQIFGGLHPVSVGERDELIALLDDEPDPIELVAFLSRRLAPIELRNTEGEPLMLCDATLRSGDPAALSDALDDAYGPHDEEPDGARSWWEQVIADGVERIRAQLELRGDELRVHANSAARFDRVLAAVRRLDPSAAVLSETRQPAGDTRTLLRLAGGEPAGPPPGLDPAGHPELAAALADLVGGHEAAWLDEPIPALSGRTPRECAQDPTRRDDLIRLLDSFGPDTSEPGMMSAQRLRAALGLDDAPGLDE